MMRQFILIFIVTSIVCIITLKNSKSLKSLYQELTLPNQWRRVEIVDEKSTFEELKDYSWEYLEVLIVGLTACIVSFTIGWSANSIRKGYADFRDGDVLAECLGEHGVLFRRMEELEERIRELELSGNRGPSEKSSIKDFGGGECIRTQDDLIVPESETIKKGHQLDNKGICTMKSPEDFVTTCFSDAEPSRMSQDPSAFEEIEGDVNTSKTNFTLHESEKGKLVNFPGKFEIEFSDKPDKEISFKSWEDDDLRTLGQRELLNGGKTVYSFKVPPSFISEDIYEQSCTNSICKHTSSTDTTPQSSPTNEISTDCSGIFIMEDCESQNKKSNLVSSDVLVTLDLKLTPCLSRVDPLEASNHDHDYSYSGLCVPQDQVRYGNPCWYTETENYLQEKAISKSEADGDIRPVVYNNSFVMNLNNFKELSTRSDECRREDETFSKLDVSQSTMTVTSSVGPEPGSARSEDSRKNSRGRIPHYKKLHKEMKADSMTTTFNEKDNKNMRSSTMPHRYIDELPMDVSSSQKGSPQRQNTASGDPSQASRGQRRKKQKNYAQNSSYKTDLNPS